MERSNSLFLSGMFLFLVVAAAFLHDWRQDHDEISTRFRIGDSVSQEEPAARRFPRLGGRPGSKGVREGVSDVLPPEPGEEDPGEASIFGRVAGDYNSVQAHKLTVRVTGASGSSQWTGTVRGNGFFRVSHLPAGAQLTLKITGDGVASRVLSDLILAAGEERDIGDLELVSTQALSVRVNSPTGPVSGARVMLFPELADDINTAKLLACAQGQSRNIAPLDFGTTNQRGEFVFHDVIPGLFLVVVRAEGWAVSYSNPVEVRRGVRTQAVLVNLRHGSVLEGIVRNDRDQPLGDALVRVLWSPDGSRLSFPVSLRTRTDEEGRFRFTQLSEGGYVLVTHVEGYCPSWQNVPVEGRNNTTWVNLVLYRGITIRGRVTLRETGEPLEGVRVRTINPSPAFVVETVTDASGTYKLSGVRATGSIALAIRHPHCVVFNDQVAECRLFGPRGDLTIQFDGAEDDVVTQDIIMTRGAMIKGRVVDGGTGRGLSRARVKVIVLAPGRSIPVDMPRGVVVHADEEGYFQASGLKAGVVVVQAMREDFHDLERSRLGVLLEKWIRTGNSSMPKESLPRVAAGEVVEVDDIVLVRGVSQDGIALDGNGRPLAGAVIKVRPLFSNREDEHAATLASMIFPGRPIVSGSDGCFRIRGLRRGVGIRIQARHPSWRGGAMVEVEATAVGARVAELELKKEATIEGLVTGPDGPLPNIFVLYRVDDGVSPGEGFLARGGPMKGIESDENGRFQIKDLPGGRVFLSIQAPPHWEVLGGSLQSIEVRAGEETAIHLRLLPVPVVAGIVLDEDGRPLGRVHLELFIDKGKTRIAEAFSRPNGEFQIMGINEGEDCILSATFSKLDGKDEVTEVIPNIKGGDRGICIVLKASRED